MIEDASSQTQPALDTPVPPSMEIQHPPVSIGKKLLTIAFSIIVTVSFNFLFGLLANYIIEEFFFSESRNWSYDSFILPAMFLFVIPSALLYIFIFLFWKSHSFLRKCFLFLNLCFIGLGILLYILWPTPLNGCSEEASYYRVAGILIYSGDPWDWESTRKVPEAYIWNFRCRPDDNIYDGQTNKYIYYSGAGTSESLIIAGADPATFESFRGTYYAKDKDNVFMVRRIILEADPATFSPILTSSGKQTEYSKDKNNVYWGDVKKSELDANTFQYIGSRSELSDYFKDKNNVYFNALQFPEGTDPDTFEFLSGNISRDKNRYYDIITPILNIDPIRWKYVGESFFTDAKRVYSSRTKDIIRGIDTKNFSCDKETKKCGDKNYFYYISQDCSDKDCNYALQKTKIFTLDEVLLHNTPGDCLVEVGGEVYNITKYYTEPGYNGPRLCNKDFIIKTYHGLSNSDTRWNLETREKYKIGEIAQT